MADEQNWFGLDLPPLLFPESWKTVRDPYTKHLFLMNEWNMLAVAMSYLVIVWVGMRLMKKREAFDLWGLRVIHNGAMVVLSLYMTVKLTYNALKLNPTQLWCPPNDYSETGNEIAWTIWLFYISKPVEFLDTYIMVLRKKDAQITFLHVYHHFSIFIIWHINSTYHPRADSWFPCAFNSLVHVLMYGYYFLITIEVTCPWKQYITQLQILQFVSFVSQGAYGIVYGCANIPLLYLNMFYAFSLLALFVNFYISSYKKGGNKDKGAKDSKGAKDKKNY